jgi:hypothetical protein
MSMPALKRIADDGTRIVNALAVHPQHAGFLIACAYHGDGVQKVAHGVMAGGASFNPCRVLNKMHHVLQPSPGEEVSEAS